MPYIDPNTDNRAGFACYLYQKATAEGRPRRLVTIALTLGPGVVRHLGLQERDRVSLLVGSGAHAGSARLTRDGRGAVLTRTLPDGSVRVRLYTRWFERIGVPHGIEHTVPTLSGVEGEGQVYIDLPDWLVPKLASGEKAEAA